MPTRDDIEVAKLAAITSGELKKVDSSMMERNARGPANRLDPRSFINQQGNRPVQQNATRPINNPNIIQAPVARPAGREVIGTQPVNVNELLIPMPEGIEMPAPTLPPPPDIHTNNITPRSNFKPIENVTGGLEARIIKLEKKVNKIDKKINTLLKKIK